MFIRPDGIPYNEKYLLNLIMRKWSGDESKLYIGGNMRRRLLGTVLQIDKLSNHPGTQQMKMLAEAVTKVSELAG